MSDQHESPIKTPRQLVIIVVLAFVVPITLIVLLSQLVTSGEKGVEDNQNAVLARIKPVGDVTLAEPSGPKGQASGEAVFNQVCKTCHEAGLAGSPKFGDKAAWAKVIAQGQSIAVDHAIKGLRGMPAKGGNPDLEGVEVERAVVYMANQAGAGWKEPPAPGGKVADRSGEQVVAAVCGRCHEAGTGGAPKIGDRAAWTPRVAKGLAYVTQAALKGHGSMPARGGMAELSDNEVKRAVEYMFNAGTGAATGAGAAAAAPAAVAAAAPAAPPAASAPDGKKVYDGVCAVCHGTGVAGAPKFGDKAAWAPRLKTGMDTLYGSAIKGKAAMPPKGGNAALSDGEVKSAVDYMTAAAK
jgi:cytochrome c5